ncbi:hypothetical protein HU200_056926 [Digitaria exilis]|uniref:Uncharacterized protein n=1 Tax=Digitaria exilis TaxID=1010633 RepID=A0A835E4P6_9POAL|nr:hypothetical protein HU200_056926 [Digitaria exilis]
MSNYTKMRWTSGLAESASQSPMKEERRHGGDGLVMGEMSGWNQRESCVASVRRQWIWEDEAESTYEVIREVEVLQSQASVEIMWEFTGDAVPGEAGEIAKDGSRYPRAREIKGTHTAIAITSNTLPITWRGL